MQCMFVCAVLGCRIFFPSCHNPHEIPPETLLHLPHFPKTCEPSYASYICRAFGVFKPLEKLLESVLGNIQMKAIAGGGEKGSVQADQQERQSSSSCHCSPYFPGGTLPTHGYFPGGTLLTHLYFPMVVHYLPTCPYPLPASLVTSD